MHLGIRQEVVNELEAQVWRSVLPSGCHRGPVVANTDLIAGTAVAGWLECRVSRSAECLQSGYQLRQHDQ